jgi:hypothetical protein
VIPEQFALFLALQSLVVAALGGGALGLGASFALRLRWSWGRLFRDMFVAALATLIMVWAVTWYDSQRQTSHDQVWAFVFSGAVVPALGRVLIHLARGTEGVRLK